ncbi:helix-turn-helix domain-containing protein [Actinopolymorpha sp. B11F2]|uniref:winged helix-turn-helix transcriptional regulator n=1 Tax=Actinopolymorpha sp. B11F2 TaxID=3160862 RepID=UPI0032E41D69
MLGRTYEDQICSISRTLEVVGERWTLLILRDLFFGLRRFGDLQDSLGIARNVLTERLNRLVEDGLVERVPYQERPVRNEYHLTAKGLDLLPVLLALMRWGDRHRAGTAGPPRLVHHASCGGEVEMPLSCSCCGQTLQGPDEVEILPGPAAR